MRINFDFSCYNFSLGEMLHNFHLHPLCDDMFALKLMDCILVFLFFWCCTIYLLQMQHSLTNDQNYFVVLSLGFLVMQQELVFLFSWPFRRNFWPTSDLELDLGPIDNHQAMPPTTFSPQLTSVLLLGLLYGVCHWHAGSLMLCIMGSVSFFIFTQYI